jgi:hypothetical protein
MGDLRCPRFLQSAAHLQCHFLNILDGMDLRSPSIMPSPRPKVTNSRCKTKQFRRSSFAVLRNCLVSQGANVWILPYLAGQIIFSSCAQAGRGCGGCISRGIPCAGMPQIWTPSSGWLEICGPKFASCVLPVPSCTTTGLMAPRRRSVTFTARCVNPLSPLSVNLPLSTKRWTEKVICSVTGTDFTSLQSPDSLEPVLGSGCGAAERTEFSLPSTPILYLNRKDNSAGCSRLPSPANSRTCDLQVQENFDKRDNL